jgi:hypothetical protein
MSALFELNTGIVESQVGLNRTLELRQTPHLRLEDTSYPPKFDGGAYGYTYVETALEELYTDLTTNWMYSAVIQTTLDGPGPEWSKDDWSFVPVSFADLEAIKETYHDDEPEEDAMATKYSAISINLTTPAIRARLECSPTDDVANTTWWLEQRNYTLASNQTKEMNVIDYLWNFQLPSFNYTTPVAPDSQFIQCCFNQTEPSRMANWSMPVLVAYWTNNFGLRYGERSVTGENGNITVKWIYGEAGTPINSGGSLPPLMFPKPPKLQSLNCMPVIETSEAEVVVDKETRRVESYKILRDPVLDESAWSDNFVLHDVSNPDDPAFIAELQSSIDEDEADEENPSMFARQNMTTRYDDCNS